MNLINHGDHLKAKWGVEPLPSSAEEAPVAAAEEEPVAPADTPAVWAFDPSMAIPSMDHPVSDASGKDLMGAIERNDGKAAQAFLQEHCNPNWSDSHGYTPLHLCARHNRVDLARLLLLFRADVNAQADDGCSPIHLAAAFDHPEVAAVLIDAKAADVNRVDHKGNTPWHTAREEDLPNHEAIIELLKNRGARFPNANHDGKRPGQNTFKTQPLLRPAQSSAAMKGV